MAEKPNEEANFQSSQLDEEDLQKLVGDDENNENDVLFQKVTQAYSEKKKAECSYQESNLRPSDY